MYKYIYINIIIIIIIKRSRAPSLQSSCCFQRHRIIGVRHTSMIFRNEAALRLLNVILKSARTLGLWWIMLLWMVAVADGKMMDRRHQCQIFGAWVPNLWCMLPRNASNLLAGWKEPKTPKFEWPSRNKSLPSSASKVPEALSQHSFERSSKSFHNPSNIVPTLGSHFGKIRRCEIFFDK